MHQLNNVCAPAWLFPYCVTPPSGPPDHCALNACLAASLAHTPFVPTLLFTPLYQGRLTTALEYLEYVPGEASTTVAVLKDRIFRSGAPLPHGAHAPPFPFILEDVRPVATPAPAPKVSAKAGGHETLSGR